MAFNQPLVPVLPVARELLAKTKWKSSKSNNAHDSPLRLLHPRAFALDDDRRLNTLLVEGPKQNDTAKTQRQTALKSNTGQTPFTALPLTSEPEPMDSGDAEITERPTRQRVKSLFGRSTRAKSRSKSRGPSKVNQIFLSGLSEADEFVSANRRTDRYPHNTSFVRKFAAYLDCVDNLYVSLMYFYVALIDISLLYVLPTV